MSNLQKLICEELERQLSTPRCIPQLPAGAELLWRWFADLNRSRSVGFAGPDPLRYAEIDAYARMMRQPIEPRHVAIIMAMDATYLRFHAQRQTTPDGVKVLPPVSRMPLSAGLIDAMFG